MREFKKNTWTLIKRLSLGLALAVPGLYQGHAQAQTVINFNGTITGPACLLRVTSGGTTIPTNGNIILSTLDPSKFSGVNRGESVRAPVTNFSVDLSSSDGTGNCANGSKFQVILVAPNASLVDTSLPGGRPILVNQASGAQVGIEFQLVLSAAPFAATVNSLPQVATAVTVSSATSGGISSQTNLAAVNQTGGKFDFMAMPVRLAPSTATITPGTYGGSITIYASFL